MTQVLPEIDLPAEVLQLVQQIPRGRVTTYGDLARALGDDKTRSARWLGEFLQHHPHDAQCLCHRVVRSNGEVGLHISGRPDEKSRLLRSERIAVSEAGIVDLSQRFTGFHSSRPLEKLREFQRLLADRVQLQGAIEHPETFAGVDVAYAADGTAWGAYVLLDAKTLQVQVEIVRASPVSFPYIPGYLTYRELPVFMELCSAARAQGALADVIFCDGNGQLHPWRAGIASCLGALVDHPVIGVGKSLLCGRIVPGSSADAVPLVEEGGETIAAVLQSHSWAKPVYVSVGNRLTLAAAVALTRAAFANHRLPKPVFLADRLTKRLKQPIQRSEEWLSGE